MSDNSRYDNIGFTGLNIQPWRDLIIVLKKHHKVLRVNDSGEILIDCHTAEELEEEIKKINKQKDDE